VLLAVVAATLFAVAAVLQQRGARTEARMVPPGGRRFAFRLSERLLGSPVWLTGTVVDGIGFAAHASALHLGSLGVVQPVLTLTLPISLVIAGARPRSRLSSGDWSGVGLLCAGVALFLGVAAPSNGPARSSAILFAATVVTAAVIALCTVAGRGAGPAGRALSWGTAAAIAFGLTAALTKAAVADLTTAGIPGLLLDWPFWVLIVVGASGVLLEQGAFAAGPLAAAMLPITLVNPLTATVLGLLAWREHVGGGPFATLVSVLVGMALAGVGTLVVSRSALLQPPRPRVR
jgi:hypothetical protein